MKLYSILKRILTQIVPKSVLFHYEYLLRYIYYLKFIGDKYQCNICNKKIKSFITVNNDRLCPRCGSLQRTRRLWNILQTEFLKEKQKILDFSPSRSIYRVMKKGNYFYFSSDLSRDFISDVTYDITDIDSVDNNFNLIICSHILEHIEDDLKAMNELIRVLKKGGYCIVQTPSKDGEIIEDYSIISPEDRERHFGQPDHVRIYSIEGLKNRLESVGFQVEIRSFNEEYENICGFNDKETVLICYKARGTTNNRP